MIHSTISNKYHKVVVKLFTFVIWIMLWQVIYWIVGKEVLIVSPFQVIERILELIRDKSFFIQIGMSFIRVLLGFILAVFLGLVAGILTGKSDLFYEILSPFFHVIQATPVASFIILALIWIKTGYVPVFIAFLIVFPIVTSNIATGVKQVDRKLLEMSKVFQFSLNKKLQYIYYTAILPYFMSACRTGIGLAWKSAIAAEVICTPVFSIGKSLYESKIYLETLDLFAWTATVVVLSILIEKIFGMLMHKLTERMDRAL